MKASMRNDAAFRTYTVSELARLSGTSVRTLHHYDAIGLLKPATVGENGYRHYGRTELLRLQQILLHRELGAPLCDIPALLKAEGTERLEALRAQKARLEAQADHFRRLALTIDRTIADLEGRQTIMDKDIYSGFTPEQQAGYEAWIIGKYGTQAARTIEASKAVIAAMSADERRDWQAELTELETDLARAMTEGAPADDPALDPVLARHHAWVARSWTTAPDARAYAGLGRMYVEHPDFHARYEAISPGFGPWLAEAMAAFGERALV